MIKRYIILLLAVALFAQDGLSQRKRQYPAYQGAKKPSANELFLRTQWWLGFKAGTNITRANPETSYSGFNPLNYESSDVEKKYDDWGHFGGHAGIEITFYHRGFSFTFQPNYRRQTFSYSNEFTWTDSENQSNQLILNYNQLHKLDFIEFPLMLKYDITRGKVRPFVMAGGYFTTMIGAIKDVEINGTDFASGNSGPFETERFIIGADDSFIKSSMGLIGGAGVSYDVFNVRLTFDVMYRMGLTNITNVENRYSTTQVAGIGDALDDVMLDNVSFSLACLFPLRFLSKDYSAN